MNDHQQAAESLRLLANALEAYPDSSLTGELTFKRQIPVSRKELDDWARSQHYVCPLDTDRTTTHTLSFAIEPEVSTRFAGGLHA